MDFLTAIDGAIQLLFAWRLFPRWPSRHVFHHHANSMLVVWLVLFSAHAVFRCFLRNLRPVLRRAHTVIHFANLINADLLTGAWHPARAP